MDLLQSVVEIVTYGDRQDPFIFEYDFHIHLNFFVFFYLMKSVYSLLNAIVQMFHGTPSASRIRSHTKDQ